MLVNPQQRQKESFVVQTESGSASPLSLSCLGLKPAVMWNIRPEKLELERFPPSPSASTAAVLSGKVTGFTERTEICPTVFFLTFHVFSSDNIFNYSRNHECVMKTIFFCVGGLLLCYEFRHNDLKFNR